MRRSHGTVGPAKDPSGGPVLVTGGCGFIGHHLVSRLVAAGRPVRVLDDLSSGDPTVLPSGVELAQGDVAKAGFVRDVIRDVKVVFHLAAVASVQLSNTSWVRSHVTNSVGSVTVMEAMRDVVPDAPFIYASSAAAYGGLSSPADVRVNETVDPTPVTFYGIDKRATEMHAAAAGRLFGLRSFGLRFFNVYGPGQAPDSPYSGVISRFIAQALEGAAFSIFGDGAQTRDFVYVDDVVRALLLAEAAATAGAPIVNICTGRPTAIVDLAALIARLLGTDAVMVHLPPRPGDIRYSLGDPSLASILLNWRAEVELETGLTKLLAASST